MEKPNCYKCVHCLPVPGDAHKRCNNSKAKVEGHEQGIQSGWFMWPVNFDPTWLISCDGFSDNPDDKMVRHEADPFLEMMSILKR